MSRRCELLDDGDIPEACNLFARVFGQTIEPDHWHWKYKQGPRLSGINLVIYNAQGRMIGHVGASIFAGRVNGRTIPMAQLSDVMVEPAERSSFDTQGVYAQLMRGMQDILAKQHPEVFAYGFVGIRPHRLGSRMGLYKSQQECRAGILSDTQQANWRDWVFSAHPCQWTDAMATPIFDRIWQQKASQSVGPTIVRDKAYMNWRYVQHPRHTYQLWIIRSMMVTFGWVVTRCMPSGQHMVIDCLPVQGGAVAAAGTLASLTAVARNLQRAKAGHWPGLSAWNIETPESRSLEPVIGVEFKVGQWHSLQQAPVFMPGDTDVF